MVGLTLVCCEDYHNSNIILRMRAITHPKGRVTVMGRLDSSESDYLLTLINQMETNGGNAINPLAIGIRVQPVLPEKGGQ